MKGALLTQDEAAARLRCSPSTVARLRRTGSLAYIPGRPVKIREEDLEGWIRKHALRRTARAGGKSVGQNKTPGQDAAALDPSRRAQMIGLVLRR